MTAFESWKQINRVVSIEVARRVSQMMNKSLRLKLLLPTLVFAGIIMLAVSFIFISNYTAFQTRMQQLTAQRRLSVESLFVRHLEETRNYIRLVNNNKLILNKTSLENQDEILGVITPLVENTALDTITVYDLPGTVFAQADNPPIFGQPDELRPWLQKLLNTHFTLSTVKVVNQQLVLLSGALMESLNGPIGITVAGYHLNQEFTQDLAASIGVDLAIIYNNQLISSSLPGNATEIPQRYRQTSVEFSRLLTDPAPFTMVLLEDNTMAVKQFQRDLFLILGLVIPVSILSVVGSFRLLDAIAKEINRTLRTLHRVEAGDLSARIGGTIAEDEIGILQRGVNSMAFQLQQMIDKLERRATQLQASETQSREKSQQLESTLRELQQTQLQLVQTEKMSSLGQLVAGIAHEINNPVNFIHGNLNHTKRYVQELLKILQLYQQYYPQPPEEIQTEMETADLDFMVEDLPQMLTSMTLGADRIRQIVLSLRNFSRLDEAALKSVSIHEGLDSTLLILQSRLKENGQQQAIQVQRQYGEIPTIECYAGQLNQVFMNLLSNAIDALEEVRSQNPKFLPTIQVQTEKVGDRWIEVRILDNGVGISESVQKRLFDPFFTTKPIGKGTGLGLSISYQIVVDKHGGQLECRSTPGTGTEFVVRIPVRPQK